jgi:thiol reductant ABC exporter CydC subunit
VIGLVRLAGVRVLLFAIGAAVVADVAGVSLVGAATWLLVRAAQRPPLEALPLAIVGVRAAALTRGLARYGERLTSHDAALGALARLRDRVYRALVRTPVARLWDADALGAVVHDVEAVQDLVVRCVLPFASALLVSALAATAVWSLSPNAGPATAAGLLLALTAVPFVAGLMSRRSDRLVARERAELTSRVVDMFRGAAELAVTGVDAPAPVERAARRLTMRQRSAPAHGATAAVLLIAGCTAVGDIALTIDPIIAAVLALTVLAAFDVCLPLPSAARQLARVAASVRRVHDLTDVAEPPARQRVTAAPDLRLRDVRVRYGDSHALAGVSLDLPRGRRIAVVGPSGSGKSTLLSTIARLTEPTTGRITLGGKDLADWPEDRLRAGVGGVLADGHVFHDTIAANLRIGKPDATDAELVAVARRTRLSDWIDSLPDGWRTVLGEDAARASGGQRQRLLLARALLADPPLLLLDEPTEGLDAATADVVLADLLAAQGTSIMLVTHRLVGLDAFDEILVLDGGRIAQRGPHHVLADQPGPYRDLWRHRAVIG